ncbi:MAG: DNA-protecting protein DprA [Deltaproteobacteria bacterium]|nr:DNA-protecting protein DprA [Deltaproteobacteria bacterium]
MIEARLIPDGGYSLSTRDKETGLGWLALARVKGLGCASFKRLAEHFGDPTKAFSASPGELAEVPGLDRDAAHGLASFSDWAEVRKELKRALATGARLVPFGASDYPARLRTIADPPPVLYVRGEMREEDSKAVAIVGSRSASDYGIRITQELGRGLASLGFTIISGMARGIDGAAHEAALAAGGRTLAVLGCGVDVVYPPEHERLYENICRNGAIVSELPIGTPPFSFNFPGRNRLISGLALGVVVVEATEKSGSLITAGLALEQGREVFAVPGEAGASRSRGTHRLIRQGAKLVEGVEDVVEEIAPQLLERAGSAREKAPLALPSDVGTEAKRVFGLIAERALQIDEVIEASGLAAARVSEILLDLEMRGLLKQLPGKRFITGR